MRWPKELVKGITCLPHKQENLRPRTHVKNEKPDMLPSAYNPGTGKGEIGRSLKLVTQLVSPFGESQDRETPISNKTVDCT